MRHSVLSVPEALPEAKRRSALELQAAKMFAFQQPMNFHVWKGREASVFACDRAAMLDALAAAGLSSSTQIVPESLMRARGSDGFRLLSMLEGYEGQYWEAGFLRSSRWWAKLPTAQEWLTFARSVGAGYAAGDAPPTPIGLPLLDRPWTENKFSWNDWYALLRTQRVAEIAAVVVICSFIFLGAQIVTVSMARNSVVEEIESLKSANQKVRQDRAEAMSNLDAAWEYVRLDEYPTQADALKTAAEMLQATGDLRILSWSYDRGTIELIVRGEGSPDPTAFIKLFERASLFENVSGTFVGPERDLQLRMALTKRALQ